jgi:hypothetical protein
MNITKDEARILAEALREANTNIVECLYHDYDREKAYEALLKLEIRLNEGQKDLRRRGRRSQDCFTDLLKRYSQGQEKSKKSNHANTN